MKHLRTLAISSALITSLFSANLVMANDCAKNHAADAMREQVAAAALHEYSVFNGHRIDANGRLWKFGSTETENEPLLDANTGLALPARGNMLAWRRVWEYWLVLDQHVPGIALSRKVIAHRGALADDAGEARSSEISLRELFIALDQLGSDDKESLRQAAVRAALSDSAWSAAFISYVMHQAGLTDEQFRYSAAHWQYVKQAFMKDTQQRYHACDPRRTPPRKGDLLCYTRGTRGPTDFAGWRDAVGLPKFAAAAHCEIVVMVDRTASKMETVSGNVLQSVAMRRMKLDGNGLLSSAHYLGKLDGLAPEACGQDKSCRQSDLNLQTWSVLLKLR